MGGRVGEVAWFEKSDSQLLVAVSESPCRCLSGLGLCVHALPWVPGGVSPGSMAYQLKSVNYACRDWEANKRGTLVHVAWNKGMTKDLHTSKRERWGHTWAVSSVAPSSFHCMEACDSNIKPVQIYPFATPKKSF